MQKPKAPAEWLYLLSEKAEPRRLYEFLREETDFSCELWEEAGVLEIELPEAGSVDLEEMDCDLGDEAGNAFLKEHQIQTVYAVTIVPEDFDKARAAMEKLTTGIGGFFCGDTEDFLPVIK